MADMKKVFDDLIIINLYRFYNMAPRLSYFLCKKSHTRFFILIDLNSRNGSTAVADLRGGGAHLLPAQERGRGQGLLH